MLPVGVRITRARRQFSMERFGLAATSADDAFKLLALIVRESPDFHVLRRIESLHGPPAQVDAPQ